MNLVIKDKLPARVVLTRCPVSVQLCLISMSSRVIASKVTPHTTEWHGIVIVQGTLSRHIGTVCIDSVCAFMLGLMHEVVQIPASTLSYWQCLLTPPPSLPFFLVNCMQCDRCWLNSELFSSFVSHAHEPCRRAPALPSIMGKNSLELFRTKRNKEYHQPVDVLSFPKSPSRPKTDRRRISWFLWCPYLTLCSEHSHYPNLTSKHSSTTSQWCSSSHNLSIFQCFYLLFYLFLIFFTFHPSPKPFIPVCF